MIETHLEHLKRLLQLGTSQALAYSILCLTWYGTLLLP